MTKIPGTLNRIHIAFAQDLISGQKEPIECHCQRVTFIDVIDLGVSESGIQIPINTSSATEYSQTIHRSFEVTEYISFAVVIMCMTGITRSALGPNFVTYQHDVRRMYTVD